MEPETVLHGEIVGLDFERDGVTIVLVAIPDADCPRLGKQRVQLSLSAPGGQ